MLSWVEDAALNLSGTGVQQIANPSPSSDTEHSLVRVAFVCLAFAEYSIILITLIINLESYSTYLSRDKIIVIISLCSRVFFLVALQ